MKTENWGNVLAQIHNNIVFDAIRVNIQYMGISSKYAIYYLHNIMFIIQTVISTIINRSSKYVLIFVFVCQYKSIVETRYNIFT